MEGAEMENLPLSWVSSYRKVLLFGEITMRSLSVQSLLSELIQYRVGVTMTVCTLSTEPVPSPGAASRTYANTNSVEEEEL
jgi:hypothetical protein